MFFILLTCGLLPWIFSIWNIYNLALGKRRPIFEGLALFSGVILSTMLYHMWGTVPWDQPTNTMAGGLDIGTIHEPISGDHAALFAILCILAMIAYLWLKFAGIPGKIKQGSSDKMDSHEPEPLRPPLLHGILALLIFAGCVCQTLFLVQLGDSADWITWYLRLLPANFLLMALFFFRDFLLQEAERQKGRTYKNGLLRAAHICLTRTSRWGRTVVFFLVPLLFLCAILLLLFGQQPDGFLRVFTETSEWTLSTKISPPPVTFDTHYLCTVSLRGHRKLVRPLRYGIRRGEKIVVNRQLCVANAFEELIQEKTPRFHRAVRRFYDTYGYPISRWIRTAWTADMVYLLMKPLEWFFVAVLYLLDKKPENRIARQYLPKEAWTYADGR
ncbi:DUF6688 domain-containing protein [Hominifimenecus sp. rT4P-3]|uniref:DUF6688 domain-containing protein n=1 Tax=Hominifimenecus sp. rT4P-3 TaxID=3242979 RepID=UPI003DA2BB98